MPVVRIYEGNLFDSTTQCKVNTVNTVGVSGTGIALYLNINTLLCMIHIKNIAKMVILK